MEHKSLFSFLLPFLLLVPLTLPAQSPVLNITGGRIQGVASGAQGITVYKGIPYAAPPVGELRWKRPQPVKPWKGVRRADTFGNISWQGGQQPGSFYWREFYQNEHTTMSEDCLYLNVWAPSAALGKPGSQLPVVMWVHGGAYMNGYGNEITMNGDAWARRGVILVTINYRLGLLGFLCHPALSAENGEGISGNYGTFDQVAALQWVHDNIAQFGGNPDNITVMGQSAGAASVKNLVISPLSRGLVRHAIIQSGGGIGKFIDDGRTPAAADEAGKALMDKAGYTTLSQMRAARPADILKLMAWGNAQPHTDGVVLTESFDEAVLSGTAADVDYLIGSTLDDIMPMSKQIDAFCYARDSISTHPTYQYLFARKLPGSKDGAFHSSELWYMFGTLRRSWRPFTAEDEALSNRMLDCWTNFAKYGNPNGNPAESIKETWHAFTRQNPYVEVLNVR
ncbi:MAG: carboxylesterase family protein [Prevotella sp.]|nr:carboxylesterase family protein [Prevotella sp.]